MRKLFLALPLALGLVACGTPTPAEIAALENGLTAADTVALGYVTLPACATPAVKGAVCAIPAAKTAIKAAEMVAYNDLKALQANPSSANLIAMQTARSAYVASVPATN